MNTKMGLKSKKEKQSPLEKNLPTSPRTWPDLPPQLLNIVAKNSTLMHNISYGGYVTKSYRVSPRRYCDSTDKKSQFPQLVAHGIDTDRCHADTLNIPFREGCFRWYRRGYSKPGPLRIVGCSHGLVFGRRRGGQGYTTTTPQLYLWNPVIDWSIYNSIHQWDTSVPFKHFAIASTPTCRSSPVVMVLTGINDPALVFYRLNGGATGWSKQECTLVDPYSSNQQLIKFIHAIGFEGKFYALSLQGTLAVIEESNSRLRITGLSTSRAIPSVPFSKHFKEYLIESKGEILLVFLISEDSIHSVDNVEVYRLRFDRLSWVKMESLGERTLFVGTNCFMSVNARKVGCRGNCIYFTHQAVDGWWIYDMKRGSISPGWNITDSTTKSPVWDEPEQVDGLGKQTIDRGFCFW